MPNKFTTEEWVEKTIRVMNAVRERVPLVHCLTNQVVKDMTANVLLAFGASPAMVEEPEEAGEFAGMADGLLVNLGTYSRRQEEAMRAAVASARAAGKPWVLDPVAVGAVKARTDFAKELLGMKPTMIRGNASEIMGLAGLQGGARGADSTMGTEEALESAKLLAKSTGACVVVTGAVDYVTDGEAVVGVENGDVLMTRVTGVGCAMGALTAACAAVAENLLEAGVAVAVLTGIAGELAAERAERPGSFKVALVDAFDELNPALVRARAKVRI